MNDRPFFVGYLPIPGPLRLFLGAIAILLIAGYGAAGNVAGVTQDAPGSGNWPRCRASCWNGAIST